MSCKRALRLKDTLQLTGKLEINCVMMPQEDKEPAILLNYDFIHMGWRFELCARLQRSPAAKLTIEVLGN